MIAGLAERLRMHRARINLSQRQISERIGVSRAAMSQYELEISTPPADVLMKLAALYGVSVDYLLGLDSARSIVVDGLTDEQVAALQNTRDEFLKHNS